MRRAVATGVGGIVAAFLGSLCCVGPLLFVTLGVGAGLASAFEPLRPLFGAIMLALLAAGFWAVYGRRAVPFRPYGAGGPPAIPAADCGAGCAPNGEPVSAVPPSSHPVAPACSSPRRRRLDVAILWVATALALALWTFPTWSTWLF